MSIFLILLHAVLNSALKKTAEADVGKFESVIPPEYLRKQGVPLPSYSETPHTLWETMDREYASLGLETAVGGKSCTGSTCDFTCARENQQAQETAAPNYPYPSANGEKSRKTTRQSLSSNWEPLLESIDRCNGLEDGVLLEIPVLVVLDKSWNDYYNSKKSYFKTQGYETLNDSPSLLFDRVNYLYERQFGIRFKIGRVESFPNLVDVCHTNDGWAETEAHPSSSTKLALKNRGITSSVGVEGGIVRLGAGGMTPGVYCHSYAPMNGVCGGSGTVDSLSLIVIMEEPFVDGGHLRHRASVTLAHEFGHFFGICTTGSPECVSSHMDNHIIDIMVWDGTPSLSVRSQGMMFKFLVTCAKAYDDSLCAKAKSLPASCTKRIETTNCWETLDRTGYCRDMRDVKKNPDGSEIATERQCDAICKAQDYLYSGWWGNSFPVNRCQCMNDADCKPFVSAGNKLKRRTSHGKNCDNIALVLAGRGQSCSDACPTGCFESFFSSNTRTKESDLSFVIGLDATFTCSSTNAWNYGQGPSICTSNTCCGGRCKNACSFPTQASTCNAKPPGGHQRLCPCRRTSGHDCGKYKISGFSKQGHLNGQYVRVTSNLINGKSSFREVGALSILAMAHNGVWMFDDDINDYSLDALPADGVWAWFEASDEWYKSFMPPPSEIKEWDPVRRQWTPVSVIMECLDVLETSVGVALDYKSEELRMINQKLRKTLESLQN